MKEAEQQVALAGDFNAWRPVLMARRNGTFEATMQLPPRKYQYKFVVDGTWQQDPTASGAVPNAFGTANSVVHVR